MAEPMGVLGDLAAVGNAARVSKKTVAPPQDLVRFEVKKGDNGGVIVCETYEKKTPAGRRAGSYPGGGDYKENPFGPDGGAAASSHIDGLLSQMGVSAPASEPAAPEPSTPAPSLAAVRGPRGGVTARASGPSGTAGMFAGPDVGGGSY